MSYYFFFRFTLWMIFIIISVNLLPTNFVISPCNASDENTLVAKVNDEIHITGADFERVLARFRGQIGMRPVTSKEKIELIKSMIRRHLILLQESVDQIRKSPQIVAKVKQFEDQLVIRQYLEEKVGSMLKVTDTELKSYYDANRHTYSSPPRVEVSHILLRSKAEAEQVKTKLQNGEDFAQLAKDYSIDLPKALEGGKMGIIEKGKALPELETVLFIMAEGETSDIVKTPFGYHILRVDKIFPVSFKPFEEEKDNIKVTLMRQKEVVAFDKMASELEKNADIEIFEDKILEIGNNAFSNQMLKKINSADTKIVQDKLD